MAIQVLPRRETLGSSLATGLSQGLQGLAQGQLQRMQAQRLQQGLMGQGYSPEEAYSLSYSPELLRGAEARKLAGLQRQYDLEKTLEQRRFDVDQTYKSLVAAGVPADKAAGIAQNPQMAQLLLKEAFKPLTIGEAIFGGKFPTRPARQALFGGAGVSLPGIGPSPVDSRVPQAIPRTQQQMQQQVEQSQDMAQDVASTELARDIAGEEAPPKLLQDPYIGGSLYQAAKSIQDALGSLLIEAPGMPEFAYRTPEFKKEMQEYHQDVVKGFQKDLDAITDFEKIQATNPLSKTLQLAASNFPYILAGGGNLPQNIANNILSSAGVVGAESLGLGPLGQLMASVLAPSLANKGFNFVAKAFKGKTLGEIPKFKEELYQSERDLGQSIKLSTRPIQNKLQQIAKKVEEAPVSGTKFTQADKNALLADLQGTQDAITDVGFQTSAANISQRIKNLNANYVPANTPKGKFYNEMIGVLRDQLEDTATKNPVWGEAWKTANELHKIDNWQNPISKLVAAGSFKDALNTYPLVGLALKALGVSVPQITLAGAGTYLASKSVDAIGKASQRMSVLLQSEAGRKIISNIVANSARGNIEGMKIAVEQLGKLTNKYLGEK